MPGIGRRLRWPRRRAAGSVGVVCRALFMSIGNWGVGLRWVFELSLGSSGGASAQIPKCEGPGDLDCAALGGELIRGFLHCAALRSK